MNIDEVGIPTAKDLQNMVAKVRLHRQSIVSALSTARTAMLAAAEQGREEIDVTSLLDSLPVMGTAVFQDTMLAAGHKLILNENNKTILTWKKE